ncbi:MAG: PAS domain-containing protein, partial [Acidobacteria bacterium]|nr:PAS domain-containing protein [Acidobacteriota bacterium]
TKEQSMKLGWLEALHPDDVKRTLHHLVESVEAQQPMDVEYRIWDVEKGWRWMHARGAPRVDAQGSIRYWYGTLEDIDERKLMEAKLLEMSRLQ